ncbi:MAG: MATE family efflux transporter [Clostridia bacterium]|nr:MATE family efflux transporter [Clostridia bacterium]
MRGFLGKFIGDKNFYRRVFAVTLPIILQNVITNFVSLLDNVMVGQIGTEQMTGVSIVNQLLFVFNLCIFGGVAGPGIFSAQFYGKGDIEGVKYSFRAKFIIAVSVVAVFIGVLIPWHDQLISLFIHEGQEALDLVATLNYGKQYLWIMLIGLPAFALSNCYASSLRECGETVLPMKAGVAAVIVNCALNYVLIFGKFGMPVLGVQGAAIATVISRYVEIAILVVWTHVHKERNKFIVGAYKSLYVPKALALDIALKGAPLLINEGLWSAGMAILNQSYSTRGLEVVSAVNISSTVSNLFFCAFFAFGNAVSILVGQLLGAGELEKAKDEDRKLITCSVLTSTFFGIVLFFTAKIIPDLYNTTPMVKEIASQFLMVNAFFMPINGFIHTVYFTLRCGGKTIITFIFDSAFVWCLSVPMAVLLSRLTGLYVIYIFIAVYSLDFIKTGLGIYFLKKGSWINNLVAEK